MMLFYLNKFKKNVAFIEVLWFRQEKKLYLCKIDLLGMNFIQKRKIINQLSRFAERKKKEKVQVCSLEQAENVCIFHTFKSQELLEQIVQLVNLLKKEVAIYCFIPKKTKELPFNHEKISFISKKDFNFTGSIKKEKQLLLQKQSFDLLIDLDKETSLFSLCLAGMVQAKFRIGRCEKSKQYYNLTLYSPDENHTVADYFQSLAQYTQKIIS